MFREEREKMLREMRDGPATGTRAGGEEGAENAKEKETELAKTADKNGGTLPEWPRLPCLLRAVVAPLPLLLACGGGQNQARTKPD